MNERTSLDLADFRRKVAELYARLRIEEIPARRRWETFKQERDALFASHPQSALTARQRAAFSGLEYFDYNPAFRMILPLEPSPEPAEFSIELRDDGQFRYRRVGYIRFEIGGRACRLSVFWILGYGGGLFLPFRDTTNQNDSYGGGRYLIDTIKNADLGLVDDKLVIDFNFAYNPSCAYNEHWDCALAPTENWLQVAIRAGEKKYSGPDTEGKVE